MGLEQLKRSLDEKVNPNYHGHVGVLKKNKKPLMERFRRRKINNYLEELKRLVLSALNKEVSLYNKMEKADILDMAVRYIKAMRAHHEVSTTACRQGHEHSTTITRNYEIPSPVPLQPRAKNIIYDNLCHPPREIVKHSTLKGNSSRVGNDDEIKVETSCEYHKVKTNEQIINPEKENTISGRNEQNTINREMSRTDTVADAQIWRPW